MVVPLTSPMAWSGGALENPTEPLQITLRVYVATQSGDVVCMVGSDVSLGQWNVDRSLVLQACPAAASLWSCIVSLPTAAFPVTFRFFLRKRDGSILWERLPGNVPRTLAATDLQNTTCLTMFFNIVHKYAIFLARHGEREDLVDMNWVTTHARWWDPPLSQRGVEQARRLGLRLKEYGVDTIISSPFLRCIETSHQIALVLGVDVWVEEGICEFLNDVWFHEVTVSPMWLSSTALKRCCSTVLDPCHLGPEQTVYQSYATASNPESRNDCRARVKRVLEGVLRDYAHRHILFVTHAAPFEYMVCSLAPSEQWSFAPPGFCALTQMVTNDDPLRLDSCWQVFPGISGCQAHNSSNG